MLHVKLHVGSKNQHGRAPFVTMGFPNTAVVATTREKKGFGSNEDNTASMFIKWSGEQTDTYKHEKLDNTTTTRKTLKSTAC